MFKIHKQPGCIHSGHFMVSRLDDDEDNNDPGDDTSESERDNANSVEIDVTNPDSVVDAKNLDINYVVKSPAAKDELTSWNDLDRPKKHSQKQYLTYYTSNHHQSSEEIPTEPTSSSDLINIEGCSTKTNQDLNHNLQHQSKQLNRLRQQQQQQILSSNPTSCSLDQMDAVTSNNSGVNLPSESALQLSHHIRQDLQQCANNLAAMHGHHHHQHAVTIDTSLTKLLECMSLYYSSNLTSPKWKSFKGLRLRLKYKIRLNNLIWRAWFLQCIRGRRPPGCQFNAPVETDVHKKCETIVLEGKYWKRKEKAIVDEYKKWRIFHKQKSQSNFFRPSSFDWETRASNLASSNIFTQGVDFSPDYELNVAYNIEEFPNLQNPDNQYPSMNNTATNPCNLSAQENPIAMSSSIMRMNEYQQMNQLQHHQQQQIPQNQLQSHNTAQLIGSGPTVMRNNFIGQNSPQLANVFMKREQSLMLSSQSNPNNHQHLQNVMSSYPSQHQQQQNPNQQLMHPHQFSQQLGQHSFNIHNNLLNNHQAQSHLPMSPMLGGTGGNELNISTHSSSIAPPNNNNNNMNQSNSLTYLSTASLSPSTSSVAQLSPISLNSHIARSSRPNSSSRSAPYPPSSSQQLLSAPTSASTPSPSTSHHQNQIDNSSPIYHPLQSSNNNLFSSGSGNVMAIQQSHPSMHHRIAQQETQQPQLPQQTTTNQQISLSFGAWPGQHESTSGDNLYSRVRMQPQQQEPIQIDQQHQQQHQQQQMSVIQQQAQSNPNQAIVAQQQNQLQLMQQQQQQHPNVQPTNSPLDRSCVSSPASIMALEMYSPGGSSVSGGRFNDQRRNCHINAEQKRRCNIKNGFDTLKSILPTVSHSVNVKVSKASMLQKAAVFISNLEGTQKEHMREQALLKQQIESLKDELNTLQSQLPIVGGPMGRSSGSNQAHQILHDHVRTRSKENWKFWIFSLIMEPLFDSYYNTVSATSLEESCKTIMMWLDEYCNMTALRKDVVESLTFLGKRTNVLQAPQSLAQEALTLGSSHFGPSASSSHHSGQLMTQPMSTQQQQHHSATSFPNSLKQTMQQQAGGAGPSGSTGGNKYLPASSQQQQQQHQQPATWLYN